MKLQCFREIDSTKSMPSGKDKIYQRYIRTNILKGKGRYEYHIHINVLDFSKIIFYCRLLGLPMAPPAPGGSGSSSDGRQAEIFKATRFSTTGSGC